MNFDWSKILEVLIPAIITYLIGLKTIPPFLRFLKPAQKYLKNPAVKKVVESAIFEAGKMSNLTSDEKHDFVIKKLKVYAIDKLDDKIPNWIASIVVEQVYKILKKKFPKL